MSNSKFVPHHMNAETEDFHGNGIWGRYVFLPGSDGRASMLSSGWKNLKKKQHSRAHNLYLGTMETEYGDLDVATISTGMGAPSADIIINELHLLGVRNFIRIGTAGSMQPQYVQKGSIVVPTGSVRDESTTSRYLPLEVPSLPSLDFLIAAKETMVDNATKHPLFFGTVHSKDSLYAREFKAGPLKEENLRYMKLLQAGGVIASEMETSILFTLGSLFGVEDRKNNTIPTLTGAVLAILGDETPFGDKTLADEAIDEAISFTMKTVTNLHKKRTENNTY